MKTEILGALRRRANSTGRNAVEPQVRTAELKTTVTEKQMQSVAPVAQRYLVTL